jgi:uncharacterized membrane protein
MKAKKGKRTRPNAPDGMIQEEFDLEAAERAAMERHQRELDEKMALVRRLEHEAREALVTLPPSDEVAEREEQKRAAEEVSRSRLREIRREQRRALIWIVLMFSACGVLIWLALRIANAP